MCSTGTISTMGTLTNTNSSANGPYYDYLNDCGPKISPPAAMNREEKQDIGPPYT